MCGEEPNIRIEKAGNGFIIDSYTPGKKGKQGEYSRGEHKRHVATSGHHAVKLLQSHLLGEGKKRAKSKGKDKGKKSAKRA